jgi:hypothetical protein
MHQLKHLSRQGLRITFAAARRRSNPWFKTIEITLYRQSAFSGKGKHPGSVAGQQQQDVGH